MVGYEWVATERGDDGIRVLSLNKPPVNALGRELVEGLGSFWSLRCGPPRLWCHAFSELTQLQSDTRLGFRV